jgi:hypothetical protein
MRTLCARCGCDEYCSNSSKGSIPSSEGSVSTTQQIGDRDVFVTGGAGMSSLELNGSFVCCYYVIVMGWRHFRTLFHCHRRDSERFKLLLTGKWTVTVSSCILRKYYNLGLHITSSWAVLCEGQNGTTDLEVKLVVLWRIVRLRILSCVELMEGKKAKRSIYNVYERGRKWHNV